MLIYVTILIILMQFWKQARGWPTWSKSWGNTTYVLVDLPIFGKITNFMFLGHNFSTRNARELIKAQKTQILA